MTQQAFPVASKYTPVTIKGTTPQHNTKTFAIVGVLPLNTVMDVNNFLDPSAITSHKGRRYHGEIS